MMDRARITFLMLLLINELHGSPCLFQSKKKNSQADEPIGGGLRMEKLCNLE